MNNKTLYKLSYGLYIVCSKKGESEIINGQIANTVFQITSKPPTVAVSINKQNLTHEFIRNSRVFTVSILAEDTPMNFIGNFGFKSGRDIDKFTGIKYKTGKTQAPIVLDNAIGYLEVKVVKEVDVGTHTIFIGEVIDADILSDDRAMTYEYYHRVKRGTAPKTAPTYNVESDESDKVKEEEKMDTYRCKVCNYVYDPENGDPDNGIEPGTKFEDLPEDWVCPVCGVGKEEFEKQ